MMAVDRLIVSLDPTELDLGEVAYKVAKVGVRFFKLSASNLLCLGRSRRLFPWDFTREGFDVMLDLKIWDTPDSVERIVGAAFKAGARFVTVHADCARPAQKALDAPGQVPLNAVDRRVLVVGKLTSDASHDPNLAAGWPVHLTGGAVVSALSVQRFRDDNPNAVLVVPGIRPILSERSVNPNLAAERRDDHAIANVATPAEAIRAGADYLVVGRPITRAADPVAATQQIVEHIEMGLEWIADDARRSR